MTADARGLTAQEAERRLERHGSNAIAEPRGPTLWQRFVRQLASPLVYILLFALALDLGTWAYEGGTGWPVEAMVIGAVLVFNSLLGMLQEYRSERALEGLRALAAPLAWILRDGRLVQLPSAAIVPGDVVRVEAGERIPADGMLFEAFGLLVDESILTGESMPVDKPAGDEVLSGTLAVRGRGLVEVTRTGAASSMGRLAAMVGRVEAGTTPLERRLDAFGRRIARWVLTACAAIVLAAVLVEGVGQLDEIVLFAVALAVSAVPESMPAVVTLTLALGVQRMAGRQAVVRRLQAVEALGSVTVIATDKTGTLTENRMTVRSLEALDLDEALRAMVFANDADPESSAGDPLEQGLLDYARAQGCDPIGERARCRRVAARPFDSLWKFMRVSVEADGRVRSYVKGAAEVVLERSSLPQEEREVWARRAEARASDGHRVLGLASGEDDAERDLRFLGLVMLWDPPRSEVAGAVRLVQDAGVRVVMITGDHPGTARAVARAIGIDGADGPVVIGADIDALAPADLAAAARRACVFARVQPDHKLAIVEALRAGGDVVAVTGDGVNDAPALKRADVGVAMGKRGSDVAREVADLVLLDDNFASIVAAIEEGRSIHSNIQKFICFLFTTNAAEVLLVLAGTLGSYALGLTDSSGALLLPLTAVQILWVNFITDGAPAIALGVDRNPGEMRKPPRSPQSPLLDARALRFVLWGGALTASVAGALLLGMPSLGFEVEATRTAVFLYIALAQLAFAYPARRTDARPLPNPALHLAVGLSAAAQIAVLLFPPTRAALGLTSPDVRAAVLVAAAVALTWIAAEAFSSARRARASRS